MKIKTRLLINCILPVGLALIVGIVFFFAFQQWNESLKKVKTADALLRGVFDLNLATYEIFQHEGAGTRAQWRLKYGMLSRLLRLLEFRHAEQQAVLKDVIKNRESANAIFEQLVKSSRKVERSDRKTSDPNTSRMLAGQLLIKSQLMVSNVLHLHSAIETEMISVQKNAAFFILGCVLLMAAAIVIINITAGRSIMKQIKYLQKGTETIGGGNLNYRINLEAKDELGLLSKAFDRMTENLSREINERELAEKGLHNALAEIKQLKDRLQAENIYLQEEIKVKHNFETIISRSDALKIVLRKVEQVAPTDATVLILGETGTGKELLARAVHNLSSRRGRPLVKVNCAALPATLIESELFGHEKGAFTGALTRKVGRFELAHNGTIFLDEIGDLPLELQAKLLRVLQDGEFERLGNSNTIKIDVRVIAATNLDLQKAIEKGDFREDLYYRLDVFPIEVPPLRERKEDIPLLAKHFVMKYGVRAGKKIETISQKGLGDLMAYHWPGNIRELENIIERACIVSRSKQLELGELLLRNGALSGSSRISTLEELERNHMIKVLEMTGWKVSGEKGAAKILGLKSTTMESRMKKLGIRRQK